ncbi:hypothetical protein [Ornithobacterium rhinotracheale]|uniref:hypothetical protein n=1 Tax=Ornithobacterium rhinotracheale TaxID=28251 RepID=UPI001FF6E552|nr:hypothetical protein [Ornithobacterium rhinotracheale]MCK0205780.1 hypothetical protein [Ornithobacterium rhinotracheale]
MKETIFSLIVFSIIFSCGKNEKQDSLRDTQNATTVLSEKTSEFLAEKIALDFANSYVQFIKKDADLSETKKWVEQNKEITEAFKKSYIDMIVEAERKNPELGLDFDPIINAQDIPDDGFEIVSFDEKTNIVTLKAKETIDFTLKLKMVNQNNRWLVDGSGVVNMP